MKAKILIAALLVVFAATAPILAQGNGNGDGKDASDQSDNGKSDDGESGNGNADGSNGNGNGNGNGNRGTNGADANNKPSTNDDATVVPEGDLLAIVKAGHAVSLASLLPNLQERTGGEIIDAQLVRTDRSLTYVVKVLTPDGRVGIEYYDARSGTHIEAR